jgi:uncharacterized protein (TIGR03086 family)
VRPAAPGRAPRRAGRRGSAPRAARTADADGVLGRQFPLPEFAAGALFPGRQAVSFHFVDYVVHSWDVAAALGLEARFAPPVLDAALQVARAVPGGEHRLAPGAAFAPVVAWPGGSPLEQVLALLGRSPGWKRPDLTSLTGRGLRRPCKGFLDKKVM